MLEVPIFGHTATSTIKFESPDKCYIMQLPRALLGQPQKIKKNPPLKNFVYFRKRKPLKRTFLPKLEK